MVISDNTPPASFQRGDKVVMPYNIVTKQVTDPQNQVTRTQYEYDEAEGTTQIAAQQAVDAIAARKLAGIEDMTYAELEAYIDANVTTLATSKVFIKKLAKVVLALAKIEAND